MRLEPQVGSQLACPDLKLQLRRRATTIACDTALAYVGALSTKDPRRENTDALAAPTLPVVPCHAKSRTYTSAGNELSGIPDALPAVVTVPARCHSRTLLHGLAPTRSRCGSGASGPASGTSSYRSAGRARPRAADHAVRDRPLAVAEQKYRAAGSSRAQSLSDVKAELAVGLGHARACGTGAMAFGRRQ